MLCSLAADAFDSADWVFEPKYDGLRVLCRFDGKQLTLLSRNDKPQNVLFPDVAEAMKIAIDKPLILDGEIVCLDSRQRSSFRLLQQRFHLTDESEIVRRVEQYPAYLYVFDILYFDGEDLRDQPLAKRKQVLRRAVRWNQRIRLTPLTRGKGIQMFKNACRSGAEGIVAKRLASRHVGERSGDWLKIKCSRRQEFVIGGWTDPQRSRVGLGAVLVGYYSDDGKGLIYAGKVGTGFTRETLLDLREKLTQLASTTNPFTTRPAAGQRTRGAPPHNEHVHWVLPRLVAEIAYAEWTQNGLLRQPRFEGLRPDKKPTSVHREMPRNGAHA
jgi:bifunctional non-homologous end joining protein LigD